MTPIKANSNANIPCKGGDATIPMYNSEEVNSIAKMSTMSDFSLVALET